MPLDSARQAGWLNDLWRYSNGEWAWMSGSHVAGQIGMYGVRGASSPSNVPGARQAVVGWVDAFGNFWLFGGNGLDPAGGMGLLNDLWEYSNGQWRWMSGPQLMNQNGAYGAQGMLAPSNIPGARSVGCAWVDANGNLWLFGGFGVPAMGTGGNLNDLRMYMP